MAEYESYQATPYCWLPKVPAHWTRRSIRQITSVLSERCGDKNLRLLSVYREYGVIPKDSRDDNHNKASLNLSNYKVVHVGNLVLNKMKMWQGSLGISRYEGIVSPAYIICKVLDNGINLDYLHLLLRSARFKSYYNQYSYGIRVGQWDMHYEDFKNLQIYLPPRAEQDQIVRFLDWKVSKINKLIGIKRKQIDGYREYEKRVVNDKVLHGLHNETLKESGNRWLGKIPTGWNVIKLGRFCSFQNGISESGDFFTAGTPFVGYGDVYRHLELPESVKGVAKANEQQQEIFSVHKGDIFFTRTSENIEEIGMATVCNHTIEKAVFSGFLIRCRPRVQIIDVDYMKYYLQIPAIRNHFSSMMNIVIRASLGQNLLKQMPVVVPSLEEQKEIAEYLDALHEKFSRLTDAIEKEISTMNELKNSLISDVVTGKTDVRNVAVPEYKHVDDIADEDFKGDNDEEEAEMDEEV